MAVRAHFLVQDHVEKVVILVVFASILPGIIAWLREGDAQAAAGT